MATTNPFADLLNGQAPQGNPFDEFAKGPPMGNPFDSLITQPESERGFFKATTHSLGGLVGGLGKILTAPQRATTGVSTSLLESSGVLENKMSGTGIKGGVQGEMSNIDLLRRVGDETGKGGLLTGQYTPTTSVFGNFIRELPVTTIGTLGDIILDPINLIPFAGIAKGAAKGFKSGGQAIAKEVPAIQKIGDILGKAFVTRYGQGEAFIAADRARKVAESAIPEKVSRITSDVIEKPAEIQRRVTQVIKSVTTDDSDISMLAQPIREELDRVGEAISQLNPKLLSEETFAANKGKYFPSLYTDYEFADDVIESSFGSRAVSTPKEPFMAKTLTEEEAIAKGTRIEEAGYPAAKRLMQLNIVEERQKFFRDIAKLASDEPKPGWVQFSDDKSLGDLAGKFLPAAEYKAIADIRRVPSKVEEMYNSGLSLWKTFKTAYNPATIARNDITNFMVLNPLGGVGPHRLDVYLGALNDIATKSHIYQLARKEGLEISTQQAAELTKKAARFYNENTGLVKPFFSKVGDFHNAVKNFYGSQDKFFKLANFRKGILEDGLTPTEAMRRAQFYLVDYSEVPALIEWLRKSPIGVPFISFTYGVSKPLAKTLLENPAKLAAYYKIINGIQSMNPMGETPAERQAELDVSPEWIQEGSYLRLPVKDEYGRGQYVDLQYILPLNVIEAHGLTPSNPLLGIFSSIFVNRDAFTGKDIRSKSDTKVEAIEKTAANVLAQLLPSATPFVGNSFNKIKAMLEKRPDRTGIVKQPLQVLTDVLGGIKITPIDPTLEAQKRAFEKQKEIDELRSQLIRIYTDKTLFPEEQEEQAAEVQEKLGRVFSQDSILPDSDARAYIESLK